MELILLMMMLVANLWKGGMTESVIRIIVWWVMIIIRMLEMVERWIVVDVWVGVSIGSLVFNFPTGSFSQHGQETR